MAGERGMVMHYPDFQEKPPEFAKIRKKTQDVP